jgi:hypothetical protein
MLRELEKEDQCKNHFLDKRTSPDPKVSSKSSCMKEDSMSNQGDGREMVPIKEERFANVSRHDCEDFKIQEESLYRHKG